MNEEVLLHKFRSFILAAIVACVFCAQVASAQTPASITVLAGNGQIYSTGVNAGGQDPATNATYPLVVLVRDANNHPVPNATVNWNFTSTFAAFGLFVGNVVTTTTGSDGTTSNVFIPQGGSFSTTTTPPTQYTITASTGSFSANFSMTQIYPASGIAGQIEVNTNLAGGNSGNPITANSGQQGFVNNGQATQSISVSVITAGGSPLPGVSVRLANYQSSPSASCVTGFGADPGSVLTDSNGNAVCTPTFTGSGTGLFKPVIGGVPLCNCLQDPASPTLPQGIVGVLNWFLDVPPPISMQVTPATPASVTAVSGSGQSATAGTAVPGPLVAVVNSQTGGVLAWQSIVWSVSPAGAATLANTTSTSDSNGQVSNTATLSANAVGAVTVTAALASNSNLKATFTLNAVSAITLGGLTKISGDTQTAIINSQFANPLVVQVLSSTGAPVPGIPVSFSANGGALLSATSVTTGSNGQASVTVTAPGAAGTITVTASASGFSQTFNLTVSPPGPTLTASSFVNAADGKGGSLSPCSLASIVAPGLVSGVQGLASSNPFGLGGLSNTVGGDTVTFGSTSAPILNVGTIGGLQQLTFQVPCTATAGSNPVTVGVGAGSATTTITLQPASPGVFQTNSVLSLSNGLTLPLGVFVRPDGSFVTQANAARKGETIIAYVTGLGPATPAVGTNQVPLPTAISTANNTLVIGLANAGVPLISAQLSPDLVGVYQVSFQVPSSAPSGNQVFSVGVSSGGQTYYSAGTGIPVQ